MTQYYYADSLTASWMAREFGMRFVSPVERKELTPYWDYSLSLWRWKTDDGRIWDCKAEVHPDSLPILDLQYGDQVITSGTEDIAAVFIDHKILALWNGSDKTAKFEVILRGKKHFFWPLSTVRHSLLDLLRMAR